MLQRCSERRAANRQKYACYYYIIVLHCIEPKTTGHSNCSYFVDTPKLQGILILPSSINSNSFINESRVSCPILKIFGGQSRIMESCESCNFQKHQCGQGAMNKAFFEKRIKTIYIIIEETYQDTLPIARNLYLGGSCAR